MKRLVFFIAFMTVGTLAFYVLLVPQPFRRALQREPAEPQAVNVMTMGGVEVRQLEGDRLAWELRADEALLDESHELARLRGVHFTLYQVADNGGGTTVFSGNSGSAVLDRQRERLVLEDDVRLEQRGGVEIRGPRIVYDHQLGTVRAPESAWVRKGDIVATGRDLVYTVAEQQLTMAQPRFEQ